MTTAAHTDATPTTPTVRPAYKPGSKRRVIMAWIVDYGTHRSFFATERAARAEAGE